MGRFVELALLVPDAAQAVEEALVGIAVQRQLVLTLYGFAPVEAKVIQPTFSAQAFPLKSPVKGSITTP